MEEKTLGDLLFCPQCKCVTETANGKFPACAVCGEARRLPATEPEGYGEANVLFHRLRHESQSGIGIDLLLAFRRKCRNDGALAALLIARAMVEDEVPDGEAKDAAFRTISNLEDYFSSKDK